jgi:hypothetical protein
MKNTAQKFIPKEFTEFSCRCSFNIEDFSIEKDKKKCCKKYKKGKRCGSCPKKLF